MKKLYNTPEIEVILIEAEDVCTLSVVEGNPEGYEWSSIWEA